MVAALADGAGSASKAEQGAEIAVHTVIMSLRRFILEEQRSDFTIMLKEAASSARNAIAEKACQDGDDLRNYASTLLAVVMSPDGGGALQVGDGVIVVKEDDDHWVWVFWPQRGQFINTTYFITDDDALDRVEVGILRPNVTNVAIMSDGLESLAIHYKNRSVYDPFFDGMFRHLHMANGTQEIVAISTSLEQFLSSDRVRSRTDDDVSLIMATRQAVAQP